MIFGVVFGSLALIAISAYIFVILPRMADGADMELMQTDFAHRGLWNSQNPENSLSAFACAIKHGCGIELDVQLSADGEVMVFHDANLKRMCGIDKRIRELTCAELKSIRLGNSSQTIPTLDEVLSLVRGRVTLLIEIKSFGMDEALCKKIAQKLDSYSGAFAVQSFSPLIIRWFTQYRPSYARGLIVSRLTKKNQPKMSRSICIALSYLFFNLITRPDFISVNFEHRKNLSFLLCTKIFGASGFVWTVRSDNCYATVKKEGYHAIFECFIPKK